MCLCVCVCVSVSTAKDEERTTEIFDMTAVIQHPQLLNNNGTSSINNTGTRLSFYADLGFLIITSNPDLCKLEHICEHRSAQELTELFFVIASLSYLFNLEKLFKMIQDD